MDIVIKFSIAIISFMAVIELIDWSYKLKSEY